MKTAQPAYKTKIDLTPMLDVVFIMLIFFIVTATFVRERGIAVNPPEPGSDSPPIADRILVSVLADNRLRVNGSTFDVRSIRSHLGRLHAQNPEAPLIIRPHERSNTETLVGVIDAARAIGIQGFKLADT